MFNKFNTLRRRIRNNKFLPANTSNTAWAGKDTEELYQSNLLTQSSDWYYRNNTITYTCNSDGYRTQEFESVDWANSIVIFGCSYIFGVGVDDADTVGARLETLLDCPVINMGVGGSSMLFNLHNSVLLRDGYPTPKAVVMFWPAYDRIPEYNTYSVKSYGSWNVEPNTLADVWFKNQNHSIVNAMLMSKNSGLLWEDKCPYYEATWNEYTSSILNCDLITADLDYARDMMHPGIKSNIYTAEMIAKNLNL
jgi:hypothetical protein